MTVKTHLTLPTTHPWPKEGVDALTEETIAAAGIAERLVSGATRINVIPTMPLPAAFRFSAKIGHSHSREIVVHAIGQRGSSPSY
ncbi:hypothetical protein [Actinomadura sp. 7K507]|uniref:hypothetical protein n=1 Tax=Actinomadura sp. 7K507 TaxID=2530365 RepID=UPI001053CD86|nr:hypothetical protein [Actinomadura sp. 7K507]TDC84521.1 hypothetical protein E1285_26680 [Actinomadura sp. 7K507]